MKGYVKTRPLSPISMGSVGVIKVYGSWFIATILHMSNSGDWVIDTDAEQDTTTEDNFFELYVESQNGNYPLKTGQWRKAIKANEINNSDKPIEFILITPKFKAGVYVKECTTCHAHFEGSKDQFLCGHCTREQGAAKIITSININNTNMKKPISVSSTRCRKIAQDAFELGQLGKTQEDFDNWYQKQL